MSKKKDGVRVEFVGGNAEGVTGSCIYISTPTKQILLECGLTQSNSLTKDYITNSRKFKFKPSEIDYLFINHIHADHMSLAPRLYAEGCEAQVVVTDKSLPFMDVLLKDSAYIMSRDSVSLSKSNNAEVHPIYTESDVDTMMGYVRGYEVGNLYMLDEDVSFKFIPSGHIIGAAQLILYIKDKNKRITKVSYTSDLGNIRVEKMYVDPFEKETKTNILIGECTYGANDKREVKKKDRDKDIEKIRTVVLDTIDRGGKILIPSFSLDRTQYILTILYKMFSWDTNFDIPIIVDSPLSCKISELYKEVLQGEERELFNKVCEWKNVKFISDSNESKACVEDKRTKIVLASSGMMSAGRILRYIKTVLPDEKSTVLFVGFSTENSLATKIKQGDKQKYISVEGKAYRNRCNVVDLKSFSSHMQHDDLLAYYSQCQADAIYLIHGDTDGRIQFKSELEEKLSKENKTTRVIVPNRGTVIHI